MDNLLIKFIKVQLEVESAVWDKMRFSPDSIPNYITAPQFAKVHTLEKLVKEYESSEEEQTLTLEEALQAAGNGKEVFHTSFDEGEYFYYDNELKLFLTDDGHDLGDTVREVYKKNPFFKTGWKVRKTPAE